MAHFIIAFDTFNESQFAQLILNNYHHRYTIKELTNLTSLLVILRVLKYLSFTGKQS